jgi:small redox-active disulfide protein 2
VREIKVLGPGCSKCRELVKRTEAAVEQLGLDCHVEKITDIRQIIGYGVMMTPALVVDGKVKVTGKVPSLDDIKKFIGQE